MNTRVSTITMGLPVFNGATYLSETIDSLLRQTFRDFELYLVDNASTDETESICLRYARQDPRVHYVRNEHNIGAAANFNRAFDFAQGPYFKWVAHDDPYAPTFLEACVRVLDDDPSAVLAYAQTRWIDESSRRLPYDSHRHAFVDPYGNTYYSKPGAEHELEAPDPLTRFRSILLQRHSSFCHEVYGLIRTAALRQTALIDDYYGSDRVLLAELSLHGPFRQVPAPLFLRRCHPDQSRAADSPQSQAQWITGKKANRFVLPQWHMFRGYLRALRASNLNISQKLRGTTDVLRLAVRPDKIKRLILPGPQNYFGFGARASLVPSREAPPSSGVPTNADVPVNTPSTSSS